MGRNSYSLNAVPLKCTTAAETLVMRCTRVDHELMVQSRDQWLESSGTALPRGYHNFVQIKALRGGKWGLADIRKPDDGLRKNLPVLHYHHAVWATAQVNTWPSGIWQLCATTRI